MINVEIEEIILVFESLSKFLLNNKAFYEKYNNHGVPFLSRWLAKDNLINVLNNSFFNYKNLDYSSDSNKDTFLLPVGTISHWIAGNVPSLGILSLVPGLLTKNKNIIKLPSVSDDFIPDLLNEMSKFSNVGKELFNNIEIHRADYKSELDLLHKISKKSDLRVIWGGDESSNSIKNFPSKITCKDLIFHDKVSFVILDINEHNIKKIESINKRLISDTVLFNQKACASPHNIFFKKNKFLSLKEYCEELSRSFQNYFKENDYNHDPSDIHNVINQRLINSLKNKVFQSQNLDYTIVIENHITLSKPVSNRFLFIKEYQKLNDIFDIIPENCQTVGLETNETNFNKYKFLLLEKGVLRVKKIGSMTHFEIPWDGIDIPRFMVRYSL